MASILDPEMTRRKFLGHTAKAAGALAVSSAQGGIAPVASTVSEALKENAAFHELTRYGNVVNRVYDMVKKGARRKKVQNPIPISYSQWDPEDGPYEPHQKAIADVSDLEWERARAPLDDIDSTSGIVRRQIHGALEPTEITEILSEARKRAATNKDVADILDHIEGQAAGRIRRTGEAAIEKYGYMPRGAERYLPEETLMEMVAIDPVGYMSGPDERLAMLRGKNEGYISTKALSLLENRYNSLNTLARNLEYSMLPDNAKNKIDEILGAPRRFLPGTQNDPMSGLPLRGKPYAWWKMQPNEPRIDSILEGIGWEDFDRSGIEFNRAKYWSKTVEDILEDPDPDISAPPIRMPGVKMTYDMRGNKTIPIDVHTGLPVKEWVENINKLVNSMMEDPEKYEPDVESGAIHPDDYQRIAIEKNPTPPEPPPPQPDKSIAGRLEKIAQAREARQTRVRPRTSPSTMLGLGLGGAATAAYLTEAAATGGPKGVAKAAATEAVGAGTIGAGYKILQRAAPKAAATIGKGAAKVLGPAGIPLTLVEMARATRALGGYAGGYELTDAGVRLKRNKVSDRYLRTHKLTDAFVGR